MICVSYGKIWDSMEINYLQNTISNPFSSLRVFSVGTKITHTHMFLRASLNHSMIINQSHHENNALIMFSILSLERQKSHDIC